MCVLARLPCGSDTQHKDGHRQYRVDEIIQRTRERQDKGAKQSPGEHGCLRYGTGRRVKKSKTGNLALSGKSRRTRGSGGQRHTQGPLC